MSQIFGRAAPPKKRRRMPSSLGGSVAEEVHPSLRASKRPCAVHTKRILFDGDIILTTTPAQCEAQAAHLCRAFGLPQVDLARSGGDSRCGGGGTIDENAMLFASDTISAVGGPQAYDVALGFDVEWKVTYRTGETPHPIAVLQLACHRTALKGNGPRPKQTATSTAAAAATSTGAAAVAAAAVAPVAVRASRGKESFDREYVCFIFHVWHGGVPPSLAELLEHPRVLLCGVSVLNDARKLLKNCRDGALPACRLECPCRAEASSRCCPGGSAPSPRAAGGSDSGSAPTPAKLTAKTPRTGLGLQI